jgi:hypothetical protein
MGVHTGSWRARPNGSRDEQARRNRRATARSLRQQRSGQ